MYVNEFRTKALTQLRELEMFVELVAVGHYTAHNYVGMAVDILGNRMAHQISTQRQRTL